MDDGAGGADDGGDVEDDPPEEEPDPVEAALAKYRDVIANASNYSYNSGAAPTGENEYAILMLSPEDAAPSLLLKQNSSDYIDHTRVFQYDPGMDTVLEIDGIIEAGVGQGFRGFVGQAADGYGLITVDFSPGTGASTFTRKTVGNGSLQHESISSKTFDEPLADKFKTVEIQWIPSTDLSFLDTWTGEPGTPGVPAGAGETGGETNRPVTAFT